MTDALLHDEHLTSEAKQLEIKGHKKLSSEEEERILTIDYHSKIPLRLWYLYSVKLICQMKSSWIN